MPSLLDRLVCRSMGHHMEPADVSMIETSNLLDDTGEPLRFDAVKEICSRCGACSLRLYRTRE